MTKPKIEERADPRRQPKPTPGGWYYHPFEIAICGFSGSGKTTLAEKLIVRLSEADVSVGFVKHDAHRFEFDKPGKDTYRARDAGARSVFIQDRNHSGLIVDHGPLGLDGGLIEQANSLCDALIVEGNKRAPLPKLLMLDPRGELDDELRRQPFENVLAILYPQGEVARAHRVRAALTAEGVAAAALPEASILCRDDTDAVLDLLRTRWRRLVPPIKGLVLAGGRSSRMGRDKAGIEYRAGVSEARRMAHLLSHSCDETYLSARSDQTLPDDCAGFGRLNDAFVGFGPVGGVLSAMTADPTAAWLVVSCDLPLLERDDVERLVASRNPHGVATAFASRGETRADPRGMERLPEPLCAIYEPKARGRLLAALSRGALCPRWVLRTGGATLVEPVRADAVLNANDAEAYEHARALIGGR